MLHSFRLAALCLIALASSAPEPNAAQESPRALFDGVTLEGWQTAPGDAGWWSAREGMIVGGSLTQDVPHNTFLSTTKLYQNFDLSLTIRLQGSGGLVNSGIQIRSARVDGNSEMRGYQVDAGEGWWGKLYDESRRNRVIAEPIDEVALAAALNPGGWNEVRILAEGPRIRSWINGTAALDYLEPEGQTPLGGMIGIQVHSGGRVQVEVKDLRIVELSPTPGAMDWRTWDKLQSVASQGKAPQRSAQEELAGFHALEGFEVELVTADPLVNKVVDIAFDDAGRMWAITAVEYPIDGNESTDVVQLYERGGRDQVLVFDEPWKRGPQTPRVFADGLFIPMAILPHKNGVLIGMGPNILELRDEDGDGRVDRREVVLSGFGVQDSHLLPHRFVRAPGNWVYLAQGAFNSSQVRTRSGETVTFNRCKLGRFRIDGSRFEVVGIGLNNIWGFVLDRLGDKWIQEANDLGYSLVPFEHGRSYPGIGSERFHEYSPWHPSYAEFRMGGTGLSGLALSQAGNGFPAPWDETFFVANPILNAVQSIRATRTPETPNAVQMERVRDLLTSEDKNFRPVAIHFGPDGCLYIVDWYNPIISHNEVPRDHPDRDRTSSRIWRVRHRSQARVEPPDVRSMANSELLASLRSDSTWEARAAWHQIADRQALELEAPLLRLAFDTSAAAEDRVLALWSLQDLGLVQSRWISRLAADGHHAVRREAARMAGTIDVSSRELATLLAWAPLERDPRVRLAALESLAGADPISPAVLELLLEFLQPPTRASGTGEERVGSPGDIEFECSLIRAAIESAPDVALQLVGGDAGSSHDPQERRFILLCTGRAEGAARLALELLDANQEPSSVELQFLAQHGDQPAVLEAVATWISRPRTREQGLRFLADSADRWESGALAATVCSSLRAWIAEDPAPENAELLLRIARERRLAGLEPEVLRLLEVKGVSRLACLQALVELGCSDAELFHAQAAASLPADGARRVAVGGLAGVPGVAAFELLMDLWPDLERGERRVAMDALLERKEGAAQLVAAFGSGDIELEDLDAQVLARLTEHLAPDPALEQLRQRAARDSLLVLRLAGGDEDFVPTQLSLQAAFTVEAWVRLDEGIGNADGLLCAPGVFDLNFYDGRLRLWLGNGAGDVIIAPRPVEPETWTHLALTRAADGQLSLFMNGERVVTAHPQMPESFAGLDVARTGAAGGCAGALFEVRVWNAERSPEQVSANFRRRLSRPAGGADLLLLLPGDDVTPGGGASLEGRLDLPPIQSDAEAAQEIERFARYRRLAARPGDALRGRELFVEHCAGCHQVAGVGASIGPVLDGVAAKGTEGLLRSILTPNAGVESGYRSLIVKTTAGDLLTGFLAAEDADSIVLRRKDREDLHLLRSQVVSSRFDRLSLMPEGVIDALTDEQVTDLFQYLQGLH